MDRIRDRLYISDAQSVRRLPDENKFDEIVTLGYLNRLGYDRPSVSTTGDRFVFPDGEHEYRDFVAAVEFVLETLRNGDVVLVHCQAGVSRSGGVCAAVLSAYEGIPVQEALSRIQEARSIVNPEDEIRESMIRMSDETQTKPSGGDPC